MEAIIGIVVGLAIGVVVGALLMKARGGGDAEEWRAQAEDGRLEVTRLQTELESSSRRFEELEHDNADLSATAERRQSEAIESDKARAELQAKLNAANDQLAERADIEKVLGDQFKVMANEAISSNNDAFVKAADEKIGAMVKPLSEELKRIEEARNKSQGGLTQQIAALMENSTNLANETRSLTTALKRPEVRGSWGEMQLRRVVELAGMSNYCDYEEQVSITSDEGRRERPDMVVRMPNERTIVVDAKTPMSAYLTAIESETTEEREAAIEQHVRQVKERAEGLASKSYQELFEGSPDFVVMFLPGEFLLQPALERDHELIDWAMQRNVVIATPNTLMALLKAVAMGWREAQLAEEANRIATLGAQLHDRLYTFADHMAKMRRSLSTTVNHFNNSVGSLEGSVLVSARRFKEMGVSSSRDVPELQEIETQTRQVTVAALSEPDAAGDD